MAPKRATRSTLVTTTSSPTTTTTTSVTNAQLQEMIDQGVNAALATRDANRNGDDNHTSGTVGRRAKRVVRECTYQDFMKCALTWWNSHVITVSHNVAYAMTWADLRKKMTDKYCPRNDMKTAEAGIVEFEMKCTDYLGYNQRFPGTSYYSSKPKTMQEAVEMATELMDKKVSTIAERQAENKRKFENTSRNNQNQQQQNKRQNTGRAYTAGTGEKKPYGGSKPLCAKCNITTKRPETYLLRVWSSRTLQKGMSKAEEQQKPVTEATGTRGHWHIISYSKTQEYMLKGCPVFLAHVTTKEVEDKSEKKRLEDVPIVRDFPEVFPEDLSGTSPNRQEEFQIDMIPWLCTP
ncbi:hypothetical protein Tco_0058760 [Tanacetum coccineum]